MPNYRVGICGSYGGMNLGDEAILHGMLSELRRSVPAEVTVFSRNPEDTLARHGVARALRTRDMPRDELRPEVERLDLLIVGGGGILFDAEAHLYLREAQIAIDAGVPVLVYAVSVGPLTKREPRDLVAQTLARATIVTVRDRPSRHLLEEIGVRRPIEVVADPALLVQPGEAPENLLEGEGVRPAARLIGISVREPGVAAPDLDETDYHGLLADAADFMISRYDATLIFLPLEQRVLDVQQSHAVIARMAYAPRAHVLKQNYTVTEMLGIVKRLDFSVAMRLHVLIFSALRGVPFVALPYAGKVEGFLEAFEMSMPGVHEVRAGQLIARIDEAWDYRHELKQKIAAHLPEMQEKARIPNRLAVELLKGRAPAAAGAGA